MRQISRTSLCATVAISAALAFGSTSALGQEAADTIVLPPAAEAPAPALVPQAPAIVLPSSVAEAAPEAAAEPARSEPPPRSTRRAAPASEHAARAVAAPAAPAEAPAPVVTAGAAVPIAAPPVAATEPQRASVPRDMAVPDEMIAAVALGIAGLGIAGFLATRSRRREDRAYDEVYEAEPEYVAEAPITSIPQELAIASQRPRDAAIAPAAAAYPAAYAPTDVASRSPMGDGLVGPVPTGEARQRLIDKMVAAEPDSENPFLSFRARRKRARIILQAREHRLGQQQTSQPFDWRTYRSSTTPDPATPPLVDA